MNERETINQKYIWRIALMLLICAAVTGYYYTRWYLAWNVPLYAAGMAMIFLDGATAFALLTAAKESPKKRILLSALLGGVIAAGGVFALSFIVNVLVYHEQGNRQASAVTAGFGFLFALSCVLRLKKLTKEKRLFRPLLSFVLTACLPVCGMAPLLPAPAKAFDYQRSFSKEAFSPQRALAPFTDESDRAVWELPNKARELTQGLERTETARVSQITGEDSPNKTLSRFNVWGTDLGSMTEMNGKVYMFCGDTFSSAENADWRSNVLFTIEDDDPSDGLTITGAATDKNGFAKELLVNRHSVTVIPTNIFSVDDTLYCIFMRVTRWDDKGGVWDCSHSGLAKSADGGETWTNLKNVQWPGDSSFIQTANCRVGDTMYFWGIPSGRFGGAALMKCGVHELEDHEAYCYFAGCDTNGEPLWIKGTSGIYQAKTVIPAPVGEISVLYNEYLGNFIITYLHEGGGLVMREGLTPWDGWSEEYLLASPSEYPVLYGGFMCPKYTEENGRVFYFAMSQYLPVYNIMWMRAEMPEK